MRPMIIIIMGHNWVNAVFTLLHVQCRILDDKSSNGGTL
jgi:hypothetical protein